VIVELARAPQGTRVFLDLLAASGPRERISAWALPQQPGSEARRYRARLPESLSGFTGSYVPVAVLGGDEVRGEPLQMGLRPAASDDSTAEGLPPFEAFPPALQLLAHVYSDLPTATVFGATPEGIRMAFYVKDGRWSGPRIHAHYKSEGGDWLLVRKDGVAIPDARATLTTDDGALLYYRLGGTLDLGPDGYALALRNELPKSAPLSVTAQVSTSSEKWKWLNRLTLVGAGLVDLQKGRVRYDLYSISLLAPREPER
jgi:hypothetical protein